ncbi:MAG: PAC2 family protein, partial [Nitrososphaerales archaeon]
MLQVESEPGPLRDPILLVALSTSNPQFRILYSQARELARVLQRKLNFQLAATLYSSALPPEVKVSNHGVGSLVSNSFYIYSGKERDYLLLSGHSSPTGDEYEYGEVVLEYAKQLGVKEMISFGARWTDSVLPPLESPKVTGFATDEYGINRLNEAGVTILKNESAFYFGNVIVPLAKLHDIRGYKISVDHGEPSPHPKTSIAFLEVLSKMIGLSVDDSDLHQQSKQLADALQRAEIEGVREGDGA